MSERTESVTDSAGLSDSASRRSSYGYAQSTSHSSQRHSSHQSVGHRRLRGHVPTIPTATAQLLTSTKALLQSLTLWASKTATVSDVSENFVHVGDNFKALRKSYSTAGVSVSDIKDIPKMLRQVLEESLVLEPSQQSLDIFLPRVGQIITELMKTLKVKQGELQRHSEDRRSSIASSVSNASPRPVSSFPGAGAQKVLDSLDDSSDVSPAVSAARGSTLSKLQTSTSKDPLERLQNNHALMRRASKRYSAYQTSKILSMNKHVSGVPTANPDSTPLSSPKQVAKSPILDPSVVAADVSTPLQKEVTKNIEESKLANRLSQAVVGSAGGDLSEKTFYDSSSEGEGKLFLKLNNKVKKVKLQLPTTKATIKVLFTQKFGFTPSGDEYPAIYIQDSPSEIAYELEDIADIHDGSILTFEPQNSTTIICDHLDKKFDYIKDEISRLQLISEKDSTKEKDNTVEKETSDSSTKLHNPKLADEIQREVRELKFELGKVRQQHVKAKKALTDSVTEVLSLIQKLQAVGASPTGVISDPYMDHCRTKVSGECESLVSRIDNLQDLIEVMKIDISKRRSRPSKKQLDHVKKEVMNTKQKLGSLTGYTIKERKNWNSRWQAELTAILEEQEFFKEQDTIIQLLGEDLGSAEETFDLILKCCEELEKNSGMKKYPNLPVVDPSVSMKDVKSLVLQEVENLNPDHEQRVEAIMKAEKIRKIERKMNNKTAFEQELGDFVGNEKLKDSGGIDEVERQRKKKDEENLKNQFKNVPMPST
ncbi:hypothetical protein BRETT_004153 [Brettanomyces bruxellensis]|uniref:Actin interacting protein 3 C-terminal domain-containing protein n=1 Tax=Dekkera bruxellensis TaxID=5007 RepID=A0A871R769_DEKBR|nr:uncharacterized protein BRETT_004153 [Brettanomyces bruxellensis]QOU18932.1 hypothetical protein BRETT_004153 [Brettanomyces bruxellensis]